jgi:hypothetical protein
MKATIAIALTTLAASTLAATANTQATPRGYEFCGWQVVGGGWTYEEPDPGAYLRLYARRMTCRSARRNFARVRYPPPDYKPRRQGYRCAYLERRHEYADIRCSKRGRRKVSFRWQTGA